jgi:hypothetical protein
MGVRRRANTEPPAKPAQTKPRKPTRAIFAGFYLLEADDLDQATEIAARIPAARIGGSVEIRPVVTDQS